VSPPLQGARPVLAEPCQSVCRWSLAGYRLTDPDGGSFDVFACAGCGSEWVHSEVWTPVDSDGVVPDVIAAERRRFATSGLGADEAGTPDR
jgi:hypothetical protein